MTSRALPGLGLFGFWDLGEDNWKAQMDGNMRLLSVIVQAKVLDRVAAEPGGPSDGQIYLLTGTANVNKLAVRDNGAWVYITPVEGYAVWVADEDVQYRFDGSSWSPESTAGVMAFADLTDTFAYAGLGGKLVRVKIAEDGLDTVDPLSLDSLTVKKVADVRTIGNVNLATDLQIGDVVDGITLTAPMRVLVMEQSSGAANGLYNPGSPATRATDFDHTSEIKPGVVIIVTKGTLHHDTAWILTTDTDPIVVGTTALAFSAFGAGVGVFTGLTDVPNSYVGHGLKVVRVAGTEDQLEFATLVVPSITTDLTDMPAKAGVRYILRLNAALTLYELVEDRKHISGNFGGPPGASVAVFTCNFDDDYAFAASLAGSVIKALTAATAQTDFDIRKNNVSVGTIRFAAAGTVATYVAISAFTVASGDYIQIIAPASPDATLANIMFAIRALRGS